MKAIYETKGRAREYSELAVNLYTGCGHRCVYCCGATVTHQDRNSWENSPRPRKGILEQIQVDAAVRSNLQDDRPILMCFVTDPYQPINDEFKLARIALIILHAHGLRATILTKAGMRATQDFDLLIPGRDAFACTLTLREKMESRYWEPVAADPSSRMDALKEAHKLGLETWVSFEPVIKPEDTMELIRMTSDYVDHCKVGTMNYHPHRKTIDWPKFAHEVKELLDSVGKPYYLKEDLRRYLS